MKAKVLALVSALLLISTVAIAQELTGSVLGIVTNVDGAVITGVSVTASSPSLIRDMVSTTNDRGVYIFHALPPGTYTFTFAADQYRTTAVEDISIVVGIQLRVSATLETGEVGEAIIVLTGEAPMIDVRSTDTGMTITREMFEHIPRGRNFESVVVLAPGANAENDLGAGIMIDGASSAENIWVIDGVDVSDLYTGQADQTAVFEFVEEVQVRSGGYEAEFGGSMGGVVNVITRSGGNEFHGEGTFYYTADWLNAGERRTLRLNPLDASQAEYITYDQDAFTRYELGGGIGGYVMRDRIWFFGSYLPVFHDITRTIGWRDTNNVVTSTEDFTREIRRHQFSGKVTAQLTSRLRATGSYTNDWYRQLGGMPDRNGFGNPDFTWDEQGNTYPGWNMAASADYLFSDNLYANFRGGYHQSNNMQVGGPNSVYWRHYGDGMLVFDVSSVPAQYQVPYGWNSYGYYDQFITKKDLHEKQNWSGDLTLFTEMGGSHMFKGGAQYYRISQDVDNTAKYDYILFRWNQDCAYHRFTPGITRGTYGYYEARCAHPGGYGTVANISSARWALFFQDSWSITPRLTINAGVRAEKEDIPSFSDIPEYMYPPVQFGFADKVSPRIGFAYDFFGDGRLKLYGSYGVYYDVMKLEMAEGSYGGFKWQTRYFTLDTLEWWTIGGDQTTGPFPRGPQYRGTAMDHRDWRIPSFDSTDENLMPTASREFIIGADYQLSDNMAVNVRFVHNRLMRTIEDVGVMTAEGELYYTTNPGFGWSISRLSPTAAPCPPAIRHYWAVEMRLMRRFADNWQAGGNLTISRLTGNYAGLASTDEQGRLSPNVERYFDWWMLSYDANWNIINGPMPTDRRYVLKLYGSYSFDWGLTVGLYQTVMDGTPQQTDFTIMSMDGWYPNNRNDLGRSPNLWQTDLYVEYNFHLGDYRAQLNVNVINLLDQKTSLRQFHWYNRNNPSFGEAALEALYNSGTPFNWQALAGPGDIDARFGMDYRFMGPRTIRIGLKFFF